MKKVLVVVLLAFIVSVVSGQWGRGRKKKQTSYKGCTWDGKKRMEYKNMCNLLANTCGQKHVKIVKCSESIYSLKKIKVFDLKEQRSCFYDVKFRRQKSLSRCQIALQGCQAVILKKKVRSTFYFVHNGPCGRHCKVQNVCPWVDPVDPFKGKMGKFGKKKIATSKKAKKTQVCKFKGKTYKNKCEFMMARCKRFRYFKRVLGNPNDVMFMKFWRCLVKNERSVRTKRS